MLITKKVSFTMFSLLAVIQLVFVQSIIALDLIPDKDLEIRIDLPSNYKYLLDKNLPNYATKVEPPYARIWVIDKSYNINEPLGYRNKDLEVFEKTLALDGKPTRAVDSGFSETMKRGDKWQYRSLILTRFELENQTFERLLFSFTDKHWIFVYLNGNENHDRFVQELQRLKYLKERDGVPIWISDYIEKGRNTAKEVFSQLKRKVLPIPEIQRWYDSTEQILDSVVISER